MKLSYLVLVLSPVLDCHFFMFLLKIFYFDLKAINLVTDHITSPLLSLLDIFAREILRLHLLNFCSNKLNLIFDIEYLSLLFLDIFYEESIVLFLFCDQKFLFFKLSSCFGHIFLNLIISLFLLLQVFVLSIS